MRNRRGFLKFCALGTGAIGLSLQAKGQDELYLRPPGALDEAKFKASCIKCGQCVQVCPYHSIKLLDITHLFSIGTPVIYAKERGCYLCEALPCVLACPSGALDHDTSEIKKVHMGVAIVRNLDACFARKGQNLRKENLAIKPAKTELETELNKRLAAKEGMPCDLCEAFCPYPDRQNAIQMYQNTPVIQSQCVGCGACAELCPAGIIEILPRADYESVYKGS